MRFLIQVVFTILISAVLQYFFPWWTTAIASCAVGFAVGNKAFTSFLAGFTGVALLWSILAFLIDKANHSILTQKVNQLLPLNSFLITALVGGLVGGLAALTGSLLKSRK